MNYVLAGLLALFAVRMIFISFKKDLIGMLLGIVGLVMAYTSATVAFSFSSVLQTSLSLVMVAAPIAFIVVSLSYIGMDTASKKHSMKESESDGKIIDMCA